MRIFLTIAILLCTLHAKSFFSNSSQADKSKYIGALKNLIIATQKTRGLTNNYLHGNITSMLLVYNTRKDMKKAIRTMESLDLSNDPVIKKSASRITLLLLKLNRKAFKKEPPVVFDAYTDLIEQTLHLSQLISTRDSNDLSPLAQELSTIMMEIILPYTEYLGQMRGMGSGLVAKNKVNAVEKSKMIALVGNLQKYSSRLTTEMKIISINNPNLNSHLEKIAKATQNYIKLTKTKVLIEGQINVDTDTYFDEGTAIISQLIQLYDLNNQRILEDAEGWI